MADAPKPAPTKKKVVDLAPPSDAARFAPYALLIAAVGGLVYALTKVPSLAVPAAAVLSAAVILGLAWVAWQHVIAVAPDDGFRKAIAPATLAAVLPALALTAYTLFPPAPAGVVVLDRAGASGEVRVQGAAATVIVDAAAAFKADVGSDAVARYAINLARGGQDELLEGTFTRRSGGSVPAAGTRGTVGTVDATAERHVTQSLRGAGTYRVSLERVPDSVQLPVRVTVRSDFFAPWMLYALYGFLAALCLVVDAGLAKRGSESAFAASLCVVLAATLYLHGHCTREMLPTDLFAAGLFGIFAGGLGGEVAARITRKILG